MTSFLFVNRERKDLELRTLNLLGIPNFRHRSASGFGAFVWLNKSGR
jgi:hypothetical protein